MRLFLALILLAACARGPETVPPPAPDVLRVASYNVHYIDLNAASGDWSRADWEVRKGPMADAVGALNAHVIAFQEMESFRRGSDGGINLARDWLLAQHPDFRVAAVGNWRDFPSTQPIFYRPDRLRLQDEGWYFFSPTPDVIYSRSFDGSYPAFASWARFEDRNTGNSVHVTNVHLDAFSRVNRDGGTRLIVDRVAPLIEAGDTVILAGDINAVRGMAPIRMLQDAGLTFAPVTGTTYHFDRGLHLFGAIDHVAVANAAIAAEPVVLRRQFQGEWPSDHYPVIVDLSY
ncbi:endonuclease [Palleronia abyssalis]|uniref:Endonuclease/exonuclease/phosphatase domain-containing protein n=1 Tax=Palleronia abyssalis TaxID=1501240 RepID=A0A2R8BRU8_9RHOB|nr:endonuclease [Palleronia abyssalis]SPJ22872.1 hypothetical protein PAA8504_00671 [Palleronia abyssalis]